MRKHMTHGSLFSGIGGAEAAAEWMGWENLFHCEINPFGRKVLEYWYPNSISYEDITKTDFTGWRGKIDVLTAGFPCQPFSVAGQRKGAEDDRYLWPQMLRAIREIRPAWVVGENVAGILTMVQPGNEVEVGSEAPLFGEGDRKRTLLRQQYVTETICGDLEREGYSVQPFVIPACAVGAPHRRDRVWFVAHRADARLESLQCGRQDGVLPNGIAPDTDIDRRRERENQQVPFPEREGTPHYSTCREDGAAPLPGGERCDHGGDNRGTRHVCNDRERDVEESEPQRDGRERGACEDGKTVADANSKRREKHDLAAIASEKERCDSHACSYWHDFPTQPPVCGRDDGIPTNLHIRTIQEDNTMDRNGIIMKCLREGRITTDPSTGEIFSTMIRGHEGQKIKLRGSLCNGYIVHSLKYKGIKKQVRAHQVIWMSVHGEYDKDNFQIDHINRNREDNRIENLRLVTAKENVSNQTRYEGEFTKDDKLNMLLLYSESTMSIREIASIYGCSKSRVHQIISQEKLGLDGITFPKWRSESVKAYGNAVVPQVVYEIFKAIEETYNQ